MRHNSEEYAAINGDWIIQLKIIAEVGLLENIIPKDREELERREGYIVPYTNDFIDQGNLLTM